MGTYGFGDQRPSGPNLRKANVAQKVNGGHNRIYALSQPSTSGAKQAKSSKTSPDFQILI